MTAPNIKEAWQSVAKRYLDDISDDLPPEVKAPTHDELGDALLAALATLSPPAGDRREAIARIIDPHAFIIVNPKRVDMMDRQRWAREKADQILAGLVQDEAGWRAMDTAPKDGTRILWSCGDDKMSVIHWPEYDLCFEGGYWMPLPPIRAARDGGAES